MKPKLMRCIMNMVDFQEKMDPTHREYLCRMFNEKELPEVLLMRYAQVKRMVDRIDGHLTPGNLAMIIVIANLFSETTEGIDADLQATADELAAKPSVGQTLDEQAIKEAEEGKAVPVEAPTMTGDEAAEAIARGTAVPLELVDEAGDKVIEEAIEQPAEPPELEQPVSGATGQAQEKPTESAKLWAPGMPVRALIDDELKPGKIVGVSDPSDVGKQVGAKVQLTVELEDGDIKTCEEDEVEAI